MPATSAWPSRSPTTCSTRRAQEEKTGKKVGKDRAKGKETFVTLLGRERARRQAGLLVGQAIEYLKSYGAEADLLRAIARFAVERDH